MGRRVVVDDFGTGMDDVYAVLCDETFLSVVNNLDRFTEQYNAQGLYWNYFWHVWRTYAISPFANAIAFTSSNITEGTAITITPDAQNAQKGANIQFAATITPAGSSQSVRYTAENMNGGSYITASGFLHVGEEQSGNITVKATATAKEALTDEAVITVT